MKRTFDSYIDKTNSCWLWTGTLNRDGYGIYQGKIAHRIAYIKANGEYPANTVTDHLCRVRNCVNPDHLEAVSIGENVRRGRVSAVVKQRHASVTHCRAGHEFTPDNLYLETGKDGYQRRHCKLCVKTRRRDAYWKNKLL